MSHEHVESADIDDIDNEERVGAASTAEKDERLHKRFINRVAYSCLHAAVRAPLFLYVLILYLVIQWLSADVRAVLFSVRGYEITWVEILYVLGSFVGMGELLKVSRPGMSNVGTAFAMSAVAIVFIILLTTGLALGNTYFSNTEFLVLTLFSMGQAILAFIINARTLVRTFDQGGGLE